MYFFCASPGTLVSGIGACDVALVGHVEAERGDALAEAGDAEGRRPHVHAAPAAAEVQRHADDVNGFA